MIDLEMEMSKFVNRFKIVINESSDETFRGSAIVVYCECLLLLLLEFVGSIGSMITNKVENSSG